MPACFQHAFFHPIAAVHCRPSTTITTGIANVLRAGQLAFLHANIGSGLDLLNSTNRDFITGCLLNLIQQVVGKSFSLLR